MDFLSIIIIAIGLSMDSLAICIAKGICRERFYFWRAIKIALVFGFFQGLMPLAGYALSIGFSGWIQQYDHWMAFIVLSILGFIMIYEGCFPKKADDCREFDLKENDNRELSLINWKNVVTLSFATSIDAAATGLIFASYPGTILKAVMVIGVVCLLFSLIGMFLGTYIGKRIHLRVEIAGGVVLIAIGLKILLEHLLNGA